jgi:hypothetical protein
VSSKAPEEKLDASISISLTMDQKERFQDKTDKWKLKMSISLRVLVLYSLQENVSMETLMREYYKLPFSQEAAVLKRNFKTSVRLTQKDKAQFTRLAVACARAPAALVTILIELFNRGVIKEIKLCE